MLRRSFLCSTGLMLLLAAAGPGAAQFVPNIKYLNVFHNVLMLLSSLLWPLKNDSDKIQTFGNTFISLFSRSCRSAIQEQVSADGGAVRGRDPDSFTPLSQPGSCRTTGGSAPDTFFWVSGLFIGSRWSTLCSREQCRRFRTPPLRSPRSAGRERSAAASSDCDFKTIVRPDIIRAQTVSGRKFIFAVLKMFDCFQHK